jgi:hypothetical protein
MLRPAVITRKVGGCNKTLLGALVHSVLTSVMVTCNARASASSIWPAASGRTATSRRCCAADGILSTCSRGREELADQPARPDRGRSWSWAAPPTRRGRRDRTSTS